MTYMMYLYMSSCNKYTDECEAKYTMCSFLCQKKKHLEERGKGTKGSLHVIAVQES